MSNPHNYSVAELSEQVGGRVVGSSEIAITGLGSLSDAGPGQLSYLAEPSYVKFLATTQASAVLVAERFVSECPVAAIVVADPRLAYAELSHVFDRAPAPQDGVHDAATVAPDVTLPGSVSVAAGARIGANCQIGEHVQIGPNAVVAGDVTLSDHVVVGANATIYHGVEVGARSIIHANTVIGADGFGYVRAADGSQRKVAQIGGVSIGCDVEVGAGTTIDRGAINDTIIGNGVKIDNQVQIGHNCVIGENTVICGCVGIVGSTTIGRGCMLGGGVGVGGAIGVPLSICDGAVISGMTHVSQSITEPNLYSSGTLFSPSRDWKKNALRFRQLDEMARRLAKLEKSIKRLLDR